jgi:hypothetical protein
MLACDTFGHVVPRHEKYFGENRKYNYFGFCERCHEWLWEMNGDWRTPLLSRRGIPDHKDVYGLSKKSFEKIQNGEDV